MIIHYHKLTGQIFGTTAGRIHNDDVIKHSLICPSGVKQKDVGKYVVPFKPKMVMVKVDEQIKEGVVGITAQGNKIVGKIKIPAHKEKRRAGYEPEIYPEFINDIENQKLNLFNFRLFETKDGEMVFDEAPVEVKNVKLKKENKKIETKTMQQKTPCHEDLEARLLKLEIMFDKIMKKLDSNKL